MSYSLLDDAFSIAMWKLKVYIFYCILRIRVQIVINILLYRSIMIDKTILLKIFVDNH